MKLYSVLAGLFKLDGGAMFGVVPKTIWNKLNPADENNLCTWAMRCLLIEKDDKLILIDTGMGDKQSDKFFSFYEPHGASLEQSINNAGFSMDDVTDVLLTHLHFDHCGGAVKWNSSKDGYIPTFKNAKYWVDENHLKHALSPNPREKASFLTENIRPLIEQNRINYITKENTIISELSFGISNGHTESMLIPYINYKGREIAFCADLIPSSAHLSVNYVMGYDIRPLNMMDERRDFINRCVENKTILFFEHDKSVEAITIKLNDRGKAVIDEMVNLSEI